MEITVKLTTGGTVTYTTNETETHKRTLERCKKQGAKQITVKP
ncbi:hypothetical protein IGI42_003023 [Enterococcus sp. AZ109]